MHTTTPTRRTPIVFVAAKRQPELHALGRALRELRARRGLSQEALGHACNTHRNYIGAIERGEMNPTFRVLLRLSRGLDLPLTEIAEVYERQLEPLLNDRFQSAPITHRYDGRRTCSAGASASDVRIAAAVSCDGRLPSPAEAILRG